MKIKFLNGEEKEIEILSGANLREADLSRADLSRADLSGADLPFYIDKNTKFFES